MIEFAAGPLQISIKFGTTQIDLMM